MHLRACRWQVHVAKSSQKRILSWYPVFCLTKYTVSLCHLTSTYSLQSTYPLPTHPQVKPNPGPNPKRNRNPYPDLTLI